MEDRGPSATKRPHQGVLYRGLSVCSFGTIVHITLEEASFCSIVHITLEEACKNSVCFISSKVELGLSNTEEHGVRASEKIATKIVKNVLVIRMRIVVSEL